MKIFSYKLHKISKEERKRISQIDKFIDRKNMERFLSEPTYPSKKIFMQELKEGHSQLFINQCKQFEAHRQDLIEFANELQRLILLDPINDKVIKAKPGQNWENLRLYTKELQKYIKNNFNSREIRPDNCFVISRSVGIKGVEEPYNFTRKGDMRLVYEYVDGRIIFTNLGYHEYRDSLYSDPITV